MGGEGGLEVQKFKLTSQSCILGQKKELQPRREFPAPGGTYTVVRGNHSYFYQEEKNVIASHEPSSEKMVSLSVGMCCEQ